MNEERLPIWGPNAAELASALDRHAWSGDREAGWLREAVAQLQAYRDIYGGLPPRDEIEAAESALRKALAATFEDRK